MVYHHPGQAFLSHHGALQSEQDIDRYVDFLRQQAGLSEEPPTDLSRIYQHFEIPTPMRAPLDEQQGILVDSSSGIILIKQDDPISRQRFTEGHELMELLFDVQTPVGGSAFQWDEPQKERMCDRGAAELLMPVASFLPRLNQLGMSLETGRSLAELYQTSLIATLVHMIHHSTGEYALVMGHAAQEKLRVWWSIPTRHWKAGLIAQNQPIPPSSRIAKAFTTRQPQRGMETLRLEQETIYCHGEALPISWGGEMGVIALLRSSIRPQGDREPYRVGD